MNAGVCVARIALGQLQQSGHSVWQAKGVMFQKIELCKGLELRPTRPEDQWPQVSPGLEHFQS